MTAPTANATQAFAPDRCRSAHDGVSGLAGFGWRLRRRPMISRPWRDAISHESASASRPTTIEGPALTCDELLPATLPESLNAARTRIPAVMLTIMPPA